ncbi:GNAT family N-acetyltransferase [Nocardiopsis sp. MG754419]|uniref:GNAT family N-acetyltransferase n=1 Tax=Nocardiopsis sp. MG754419 TaxID=2259865 RepID=UPI0027DD7F0A|nr:GNAT family N-acetyltransferase [Nocardiopsis sp. MG754419]
MRNTHRDTPVLRPPEDDELRSLAELRWRWILENGGTPEIDAEEFAHAFVRWVPAHGSTHRPLIMLRGPEVIGMAWLALVPRVPTPLAFDRRSGDVQCVYVVPWERGHGHGGRLVEAVLDLARDLGLERVTVHSSDKAIPTYRRHGFEVSPRMLHTEISLGED